ncbi:MAG: DUF1570 domain-containing protein, partial [Pirellulales bacterium]
MFHPCSIPRLLSAAIVSLVCLVGYAPAQEPDGTDVAAVHQWPMERVRLLDGREFFGLVRRQDKFILELVEVHRPPGKGMHLLVRPIDQDDVFLVERLDDQERQFLAAKIDEFRERTRVMAALLGSVRLARLGSEERRFWRYDGPWFQLDSTADEETTRRAVVRVEQVFAGYRALLHPRREPRTPLRIVLLGTMDEYRELAERKLAINIKNPAFYLPNENLIIAGSDLARFSSEWKRTQKYHEQVLARQKQRNEEVSARLADLGRQLAEAGVPDNKRKQVLRAAQVQAADELKRLQREVATAERKNQTLFDELSAAMFVRLAHESFHAYLQNYVYDEPEHDVPRWLNEGLAQVFEAGVVEAGALRLDAPNAGALSALKADLAAGEPLSLIELLRSPDAAFLAGHVGGVDAANQRYFYSWGLAHYLTFEAHMLGSERLDAYVLRSSQATDPIAAFEQLVG